jgi:hypothetical protein
MSFWSAVVFIVGIVAYTILRLNGKTAIRNSRHQALPDPRSREFEAEIANLRERIAVLERIATDERGSRDIAREIEALRD